MEATSPAATEFNMYLTNKVIDSIVGLFEHNRKIEIAPSNVQRLKMFNKQSGILISDIEKEIEKRLPAVREKVREVFLKAGYEKQKKNVFGKIKEFFQRFRKKEKHEDFETVTGYGTIEGLSGVNCRHTFAPFYKGMVNNQKQYDSEKNKKAYDLSQKKRSIERNIRNTKRQMFENEHAIKVATDEDLIKELKEKDAELKKDFDEQNSFYTAFCKQNGLQREEDRLYVSNKSRILPSGLSAREHPINGIIPSHNKPVLIGKVDASDANMVLSKIKRI